MNLLFFILKPFIQEWITSTFLESSLHISAYYNMSDQEHMIKERATAHTAKFKITSPTFNKLASDMFPYKELLEPSTHTK